MQSAGAAAEVEATSIVGASAPGERAAAEESNVAVEPTPLLRRSAVDSYNEKERSRQQKAEQ
jgi:hypothetical protein